MTATITEIRQAIATAIASTLGPEIRESVYAPSLIGRDGTGAQGEFFSVDVPRTDLSVDARQRVSNPDGTGFGAVSEVVVRYLRRQRPDAAVADYDATLDEEAQLLYAIQQVTDWSGIKSTPFVCSELSREIFGEGSTAWLLVTVRGSVRHRYLTVAPS